MKIEKIKPIPKYIIEKIHQYDKKFYNGTYARNHFYSYLTKNDGELVKVTVAVKVKKGGIVNKLRCTAFTRTNAL